MPLHHILAGILPHFSIAAPNPHGANEAARSSRNPRIVIFSLLPPLGPARPQSPCRDSRIFFFWQKGCQPMWNSLKLPNWPHSPPYTPLKEALPRAKPSCERRVARVRRIGTPCCHRNLCYHETATGSTNPTCTTARNLGLKKIGLSFKCLLAGLTAPYWGLFFVRFPKGLKTYGPQKTLWF